MIESHSSRRTERDGRCLLVALALVASAGCESLRGPGEPPVDIVWHVVTLAGEPVPRLPHGRVPSLQLDAAEERASGFTGCNRMAGGYLLAGDALTFGTMATTRMACEEAGASVEMSYMAAIQSVERWRRRADDLELLDGDGQVLMRLSPAGRVDPPLPR